MVTTEACEKGPRKLVLDCKTKSEILNVKIRTTILKG